MKIEAGSWSWLTVVRWRRTFEQFTRSGVVAARRVVFRKTYATALQQGFINSKFADLSVTWSFSLAPKVNQDGRLLRINRISLYVSTPTVSYCWLARVRSAVVGWIMLCQASCLYLPYTMSKTSVRTFGSRGHLQLVCRCNISLTLTQIWENISHVYGSTGTIPQSEIHSYVSPGITVSTGVRCRWKVS